MVREITLSISRVLELVYAHAAFADIVYEQERPEILGKEHSEALAKMFDSVLASMALELNGILLCKAPEIEDSDFREVELIAPSTIPPVVFQRNIEDAVACGILANVWKSVGDPMADAYTKNRNDIVDNIHTRCSGALMRSLRLKRGA